MFFNKARADDYMRKYNLDVLIATSFANITYFTDYYCWIDPLFKEYMMVPGAPSRLAQGYAVYPLNGEPALVVNPLFSLNTADNWVSDIYIYGQASELEGSTFPTLKIPDHLQRYHELHKKPYDHATPTDALHAILKDRGLLEARIGLEKESLPADTESNLVNGLPKAEIRDCTNLIRLIRMVKSEDDLASLTRGAQISERAAMDSFALLKPGSLASELVHNFRMRVAEQGGDFEHFIYSICGLGIAAEAEHCFTDKDVFFVDFGCYYNHQFSDTGTTIAMSEPSKELFARHQTLRAAMDAATDMIKPGVKTSEVHGAMSRTLQDNGITNSFPHGHSYGLEVREYPIIVADNGLRIRDDCVDIPSDIVLEAGMVFNLESCLFYLTNGAVHTEQAVVVTESGNRPLVNQERDTPYIP
jgi:Xaa-Pro aminopeptidase